MGSFGKTKTLKTQQNRGTVFVYGKVEGTLRFSLCCKESLLNLKGHCPREGFCR